MIEKIREHVIKNSYNTVMNVRAYPSSSTETIIKPGEKPKITKDMLEAGKVWGG